MVDSNNIAIIRQNLIELKRQIDALDVEIPSHAAADAGKILAVGNDGGLIFKDEYSYTPPAYSSTEEVNTGQKWIDGKDIYCQVFTGSIPTLETASAVNVGHITGAIDKIVDLVTIFITANDASIGAYRFTTTFDRASGNFIAASVISAYSGGSYITIAKYTRPAATRSDDPEPIDKGTGMITGEDPETIEEVKETKSRKKSK